MNIKKTKAKRSTMMAKAVKSSTKEPVTQEKHKRSSSAGRKRMVWHITHFQQRFELKDDVRFDRKSPLIYTKEFVGSGSDDESCSYYRQLLSLRTRINWLQLRGAFCELKNISANASKIYRGYLLDSDHQPATEDLIGSWLGIEVDQAKSLLWGLRIAGLIELVPMPNFEPEENTKQKRKPSKKHTRKTKVTIRKKTESKNFLASRETTRKNENSRAPLKTKTKAKTNVKVKTKVKMKDKLSNGNDRPLERENKWQSAKHKVKAQGAKLTNRNEPPTTPTTTPPNMPTESDVEGANLIPFTAPSRRLTNSRSKSSSNCEKLGDITARMMYCYDHQAKFYAEKVYDALGLSWLKDSPKAIRELKSFASVIHACIAGLPPPQAKDICQRGVAEAQRIIKHWGKREGKPAAIWNNLFKQIAGKHKCTG